MKQFKIENQTLTPTRNKPILLREIYHESVIDYGVQFFKENINGLLIINSNNRHNTSGLANNAIIIHTNYSDKCRFILPSPNVLLSKMTMHHFENIIKFVSIAEAVEHEKFINGMSELSLDLHVLMWRMLGANIGRLTNNSIKWEKIFNLN